MFPLIYSLFLTLWGHLGLALWCEVPHCVEDRTVTPRCFVLGRSNLEMGCCLLDIYPISFLFHKFTYPCRMLYFFRYKVILHLSVSIQEKTERTQKGNKISSTSLAIYMHQYSTMVLMVKICKS